MKGRHIFGGFLVVTLIFGLLILAALWPDTSMQVFNPESTTIQIDSIKLDGKPNRPLNGSLNLPPNGNLPLNFPTAILGKTTVQVEIHGVKATAMAKTVECQNRPTKVLLPIQVALSCVARLSLTTANPVCSIDCFQD